MTFRLLSVKDRLYLEFCPRLSRGETWTLPAIVGAPYLSPGLRLFMLLCCSLSMIWTVSNFLLAKLSGNGSFFSGFSSSGKDNFFTGAVVSTLRPCGKGRFLFDYFLAWFLLVFSTTPLSIVEVVRPRSAGVTFL